MQLAFILRIKGIILRYRPGNVIARVASDTARLGSYILNRNVSPGRTLSFVREAGHAAIFF